MGFEPRLGAAYRTINAPIYKYKLKDADTEFKTMTMSKCLFGQFSTVENDAVCGTTDTIALWHFKMDDKTNTIVEDSASTYARLLSGSVEGNNIDTCVDMITSNMVNGKLIACVSKSNGVARDIKLLIIHVGGDTQGGHNPFKKVRTLVVDQTDPKFPYFLDNFSMQEITLGTGDNGLYLVFRRTFFKSDDASAAADKSKLRYIQIDHLNNPDATLSLKANGVIELKDVKLDLSTPVAPAVTPTFDKSELISITPMSNTGGTGIYKFITRTFDATATSTVNNIRIFRMKATMSADNFTFEPVDAAAFLLPSDTFKNLERALVVLKDDVSSGIEKNGFFIANLEQLNYYTYSYNEKDKVWNSNPVFGKDHLPLACIKNTVGTMGVKSIQVQGTIGGFNESPEK